MGHCFKGATTQVHCQAEQRLSSKLLLQDPRGVMWSSKGQGTRGLRGHFSDWKVEPREINGLWEVTARPRAHSLDGGAQV